MTLTFIGVVSIAFIFGVTLYGALKPLKVFKYRLFYSVVFGFLFVSPIGGLVEKWGEQNQYRLEEEVKKVFIQQKDEDLISRIISEDKGVSISYSKNDEDIFVKNNNMREIDMVGKETTSYLSIYKRYNPTKYPYLVPFIKNDEYYVFYRSKS